MSACEDELFSESLPADLPPVSVGTIEALCDASQRRVRRQRQRREKQLHRRRLTVTLICVTLIAATFGVPRMFQPQVGAASADTNGGHAAPAPAAAVAEPQRPVKTSTAPQTDRHVRWLQRHVPYGALIAETSLRYTLDPLLLGALIKQESGFDAAVTSHAGAAGLTQLMPATAKELGVTDRTDPAQAVEGGAKYLAAQLRRFGSVRLALAAYNAGPGTVARLGRIPAYAETQRYVRNILAIRGQWRVQARR